MCVSYRKLNSITKAFEYLIPKCDDYVTVFMTGSSIMWIITVDARRGYHQILVKKQKEKNLYYLYLIIKIIESGAFWVKKCTTIFHLHDGITLAYMGTSIYLKI